jgi:phosphomannomutase
MALILESLAKSSKTISEIVAELPHYDLIKTKMPFTGSLEKIIEKIIKEFPDGKADTQDGVRVDFPDSSWVQLRASNTEPIIRIWAEAKTKEKSEELISKTKSCL